MSYEVQIAETEAGVAGAEVIATATNSYQVSEDMAIGDTRCWRVRAKDAEGVYGAWSAVISFSRPYIVGDTGPAGGIVFYDKGSYSGGWRYLEAAPASTEWSVKPWGGYGTFVGGTSTSIGTGAGNTAAIVAAYGSNEPYGGRSDYAAKLCADLVYNGYEDWFLPSKDELNEMYIQKGVIGGFASDYYWSSSEGGSGYAWSQYFGSGGQSFYSKYGNVRVRAGRAF